MNDHALSPLPTMSIGYRLMRALMRLLLWLLTDFKAEGMENIPLNGPAVLVSNHLDTMDGPAIFIILPRQVTVFAADKHNRPFSFFGWLLRTFANAIWVARGEVDRKALRAALDAVARGEMLAIAPEGTRSRTGALQKGHDGTAYLVARSGAPMVPVVAWGQEKTWSELAHLRRARVRVVVGEPFSLPPEAAHARSAELVVYTDQIMRRLASLLPPSYRGVYADQSTPGGAV
ncbi:MAG: lysophospholipid acyltransferase family protein [Anaerolineae bacterium]